MTAGILHMPYMPVIFQYKEYTDTDAPPIERYRIKLRHPNFTPYHRRDEVMNGRAANRIMIKWLKKTFSKHPQQYESTWTPTNLHSAPCDCFYDRHYTISQLTKSDILLIKLSWPTKKYQYA